MRVRICFVAVWDSSVRPCLCPEGTFCPVKAGLLVTARWPHASGNYPIWKPMPIPGFAGPLCFVDMSLPQVVRLHR